MATPYSCGCGSTFGTATDVGLDSPVTGVGNNSNAFFEYEGLPALAALSSILTIDNTGVTRPMGLTLLTDTDTTIMAEETVPLSSTAPISGNVPADGNVVVEISYPGEPGTSFSATINSTGVPEPATLGAVGLGLLGVGALARRRFRNKK
jgi:hypothetical protein